MKLFIIIATIVALSSLSATAIDIEKPPPPPPPKPDVCKTQVLHQTLSATHRGMAMAVLLAARLL